MFTFELNKEETIRVIASVAMMIEIAQEQVNAGEHLDILRKAYDYMTEVYLAK